MAREVRLSVFCLLLVIALARLSPISAHGGAQGGAKGSGRKLREEEVEAAGKVEEARAMSALLVKAPQAAMANGNFLQAFFAARKGGAATFFIPLSGFRVLADSVGYDSAHFNRILKYHLIPDARYTIADLKALREDSLLPTAEGSKLKIWSRRKAAIVLLQGKSIIPAAVTIPNIFVGENIIVHGLSRRLVPPSF